MSQRERRKGRAGAELLRELSDESEMVESSCSTLCSDMRCHALSKRAKFWCWDVGSREYIDFNVAIASVLLYPVSVCAMLVFDYPFLF